MDRAIAFGILASALCPLLRIFIASINVRKALKRLATDRCHFSRWRSGDVAQVVIEWLEISQERYCESRWDSGFFTMDLRVDANSLRKLVAGGRDRTADLGVMKAPG